MTLVLVHVSSKKICLKRYSNMTFESTQKKQQYDTKNYLHRGKKKELRELEMWYNFFGL